MKAKEIQTGCFYVNKSEILVREIVTVRDDRHVEYLSYWLCDGTRDGLLGICQTQTLANWASREATADEVARLKRSDARQRSYDVEPELLARLAQATPSATAEDPFAAHFPDGLTIRDEANALVAWAFRNGPLEDLHAGQHSELLDDPTLSRITDEEMKTLMISACRQLAGLLEMKLNDPAKYEQEIKSYNVRYCRGWER